MSIDRETTKAAIRTKVIELAQALDIDATAIQDDDIIPATGYLDSAAVLELVMWFEQTHKLSLKQDEINIDNLGSINAMADFLIGRLR